jgi:hypothetical protein
LSTTTSAVSAPPPAQEAANAAERWVEGFIEGWRAPRGPDAFAAHFRPMLSPSVRLVQPQLLEVIGRDAFEEHFVRPVFDLFPDIRGEVERWAANGDAVYIEMTLRGTLGGSRQVSWRVCDRITLEAGVAIERESYFDPGPLIVAIAHTPRAWPTFIRAQLRRLINPVTSKRRRQ